MSFDVAAYLSDGLTAAEWTVTDLWLGAFALGSNLSHADVQGLTSGTRMPDASAYDLLAAALNDRFVEFGLDHPMHYWAELPRN